MAYHKSAFVKKTPITSPHMAGQVHEAIYTFTVDAAYTAATDVIELAGLAPMTKILGVDISAANLAATTTINVGLMSGAYGDADDSRTVGTEFFSAQAFGTPASMTLAAVAALNPIGDAPVGLGLKLSLDQTAGATKKVHVRVRYTR